MDFYESDCGNYEYRVKVDFNGAHGPVEKWYAFIKGTDTQLNEHGFRVLKTLDFYIKGIAKAKQDQIDKEIDKILDENYTYNK